MNKKLLLVLIISGLVGSMHAEYYQYNNEMSDNNTYYGCQCYCSFKCGPRFPNQPGDNPTIDPETGICFCQERDRRAYFERGCHLRNNAFSFPSCCGQVQQEMQIIQEVPVDVQ